MGAPSPGCALLPSALEGTDQDPADPLAPPPPPPRGAGATLLHLETAASVSAAAPLRPSVLLASAAPSGAPDLLGASLCMTTDATIEVRFVSETQQLEFKLSDGGGSLHSVVVTLAAAAAAADDDARSAAVAEWSLRARSVAVRFQEYWQYECAVGRGEAPPTSQCAAELKQQFSVAAGSCRREEEEEKEKEEVGEELRGAGGAHEEGRKLDDGGSDAGEEDEAHVARLSRRREVLQVAESISRMLMFVDSTLTSRAGLSRREHRRRVLEAHLQALPKSVEAQLAAEAAEAASGTSSAPAPAQPSPPSDVAPEAPQPPPAGAERTQADGRDCTGGRGDTPVDGRGQRGAPGFRLAGVAPAVAAGAGSAHGGVDGAPPHPPIASGEPRFVFPIAVRAGSKLVSPSSPSPLLASSGAHATRSAHSFRGRGSGAVPAPGRGGGADSAGSGGRSYYHSGRNHGGNSSGAFVIDSTSNGAGGFCVDQVPSLEHQQQHQIQQLQQLVQLQQQQMLSLVPSYGGGGPGPAGMEGMYAAALLQQQQQQQALASTATTTPGSLAALFGMPASFPNDMFRHGGPSMQPPLPGSTFWGAAAAAAPSWRPGGSPQ